MSVISGLLYGLNFAPVIYVQNNYKNASQNGNVITNCLWKDFCFDLVVCNYSALKNVHIS